MAYDVSKLAKLGALKQMAERIAADYATKAEVTNAINTKVSSAYTAGGSAAFNALPELTAANVGLVVNVTDSFTTTDSFMEGAGKRYPAGTNVAVVAVTGEETTNYKYDALSGFVDLSGYQTKEDGKGLSANDFTDADKAKLDNLDTRISGIITDAVTAPGDNTFAGAYGVNAAPDGSTKVKVTADGMMISITVNETQTLDEFATKADNTIQSDDFTVVYDQTLGIAAQYTDGTPTTAIPITLEDGTALTYTAPARVGPVFSFNGRSGVVMPKSGDYTPEMIGISIAADEEVTEMLTEVFGPAA